MDGKCSEGYPMAFPDENTTGATAKVMYRRKDNGHMMAMHIFLGPRLRAVGGARRRADRHARGAQRISRTAATTARAGRCGARSAWVRCIRRWSTSI